MKRLSNKYIFTNYEINSSKDIFFLFHVNPLEIHPSFTAWLRALNSYSVLSRCASYCNQNIPKSFRELSFGGEFDGMKLVVGEMMGLRVELEFMSKHTLKA